MEGLNNDGFVEVAVVEYPGGDPSAASVLAEMAHVANRLAQQQRRPSARVLVTRWIVPASNRGVNRIAVPALQGARAWTDWRASCI